MQENYERIVRALTVGERLCQLAEECGELSQAALKLRRALMGLNMTPASVEECRAALLEEIADVMVCVDVILMEDVDTRKAVDEVDATMRRKAERWAGRVSGDVGCEACRLD